MEGKAMRQDVSVLICSCDKYQDLWEPFFFFFKKYWRDCPYPVYLMTNQEQYADTSVKTIVTGRDTDWTDGFLKAVKKVNTQYIIILMEDYLLLEKPNQEFLDQSIDFMRDNKISYLRLFPCPGPGNHITDINGVKLGEIRKNTDYRVSLQASIWNVDYLKKLANAGESAWDFEVKGTERSNDMPDRLYSVSEESECPLLYFCTAVVKGYWVREAVDICRENNVKVDLKTRKIQPFYIRNNIRPIIHLAEFSRSAAEKVKDRLSSRFF